MAKSKINNDMTKVDENLLEDLKCCICLEFARDPVETNCCQRIMCKTCMDKLSNMCPICRKKCTYSSSMVTKRMINHLDYECEYCTEKMKMGELKSHMLKCERFQLKCPCCSEKMEKNKLMNHMACNHCVELMRNMNKIIENFELKNIGRNERVSIDTLTNSQLRVAKLGKTGKYYCGTGLYGPRCACCKTVRAIKAPSSI